MSGHDVGPAGVAVGTVIASFSLVVAAFTAMSAVGVVVQRTWTLPATVGVVHVQVFAGSASAVADEPPGSSSATATVVPDTSGAPPTFCTSKPAVTADPGVTASALPSVTTAGLAPGGYAHRRTDGSGAPPGFTATATVLVVAGPAPVPLTLPVNVSTWVPMAAALLARIETVVVLEAAPPNDAGRVQVSTCPLTAHVHGSGPVRLT